MKSNYRVVDRNQPYVLLLDTENLSMDEMKQVEDQISARRLFVIERKSFERSNQPIGKKKHKLLSSLGYKFIDIGETDEKNAVDNAIKEEAWRCYDRYQRNLIIVSCDGGFSSTISDLTKHGVKVFLPRLQRASGKLKSIRSVTESFNEMSWRTKSSDQLIDAINRMKKAVGVIDQSVKANHQDLGQQEKFEGIVEAMRANPILCVDGWLYPERLKPILEQDWIHSIMLHLKHRSDFRTQKIARSKYLIAAPVSHDKEPLPERHQKLKLAKRIIWMFGDRLPKPSKTNKLIRQALYEISICDPTTRMFLEMFDRDGEAANMVAAALAFDEKENEEFIYRQLRPIMIQRFERSARALEARKKGAPPRKKSKRPVIKNNVRNFCYAQANGSNRHLAIIMLHSDLEGMCQAIERRFFDEHPEYLTPREKVESQRHAEPQAA